MGEVCEFLALIAPDTVEYWHDTWDEHRHAEFLPVACPLTRVRPDITRRKPSPKSSGVIGHHLTRSTGIDADAWTSCQRHHACDHQSARTGCRWARQHARILRRRTRFTRNAWRSSSEQSTGNQGSCRTVHEAADSRTALLRSGCRYRVLTGKKSTLATTAYLTCLIHCIALLRTLPALHPPLRESEAETG